MALNSYWTRLGSIELLLDDIEWDWAVLNGFWVTLSGFGPYFSAITKLYSDCGTLVFDRHEQCHYHHVVDILVLTS